MRARVPALVAISISAACSNDMTVQVRGGDRPPNPEELIFSDGVAGSGGLIVNGNVTVDRFQIVLRGLRLQEAPTDGGADAPGAEYFGPGPYLVDLAADGLTGGTFTELVPKYIIGPKSYYEMDINLQPVSASDVELKPGLAPLQGRTFRITGSNAQGVPFTVESTMSRELIRPAVYRLGTNHNNLDVNIAPNRWFELPDGGTVDPADPAAHPQIEENVAASIDAYEDDNMDGQPDPLG
jgi:hypothetical protein